MPCETIRSNKRAKTELTKVRLLESNRDDFATVKRLEKTDPCLYIDYIEREIAIIRDLKHENVTQFIGSRKVPEAGIYTLMTEWASLGPVDVLLKTKPLLFDDTKFFSLSIQATKALIYLQNRKVAIVHGDIRSRNIFVTKDTNLAYNGDDWILKLAEFGCSTAHSSAESAQSNSATNEEKGDSSPDSRRWQAPEVLLNGEVSNKSDVWSLHVFFAEMLLKKTLPFKHITRLFTLLEEINAHKKPFDISTFYPFGLRDLFNKGWDISPANRYSVHEIHHRLLEMQPKVENKMPRETEDAKARAPGTTNIVGAEGYSPF